VILVPEHKNWTAMKPKLRRAFKALADDGIKAKANHSISISNGIAELERSGQRGYCFYHAQDAERGREQGEVWLAFGVFAEDPKDADIVKVGKLVKKALVREGLHVVWNGSAESRIEVHLSKAAWAQKGKDDRARWKARDKVEAGLDVAAIDGKLLAAAKVLEKDLLAVSDDEWHAGKEKVRARAKKATWGGYVASLPLGRKHLDGDGTITIFIWGEHEKMCRMLAVRLKHELHKLGFKARVQSGMVHILLS
jgi:hypothetical protein